jgi:hypothetical protein
MGSLPAKATQRIQQTEQQQRDYSAKDIQLCIRFERWFIFVPVFCDLLSVTCHDGNLAQFVRNTHVLKFGAHHTHRYHYTRNCFCNVPHLVRFDY